MEESLTFEVKNNLSELDVATEKLERFGKRVGLSVKGIFQIKFALEEILVNIISYAYTDQEEHVIKVGLTHNDDVLKLEIIDDGIAFDPVAVESPDPSRPLESREEGGLGLFLTKNLMSRFSYQRRGNKNCLTITKSLANI